MGGHTGTTGEGWMGGWEIVGAQGDEEEKDRGKR
jgi:hypothetical protein